MDLNNPIKEIVDKKYKNSRMNRLASVDFKPEGAQRMYSKIKNKGYKTTDLLKYLQYKRELYGMSSISRSVVSRFLNGHFDDVPVPTINFIGAEVVTFLQEVTAEEEVKEKELQEKINARV